MKLEKKSIIKFNVLAIICIICFSFVVSPVTLQNDTYYTIKIGEHIVNNGIDMQDPFSWHEDLPYTYPHWLYDVGVYLIFNLGQSTGLQDGGFIFITISTALLSCCLGVLIYLTSCKISKNNLFSFIFTFILMYLIKDFIAARAQLVTFNLFVLTILFIENFLTSKKKRYLIGIVLISIAIANIHVAVWPFFFVLFMPYIAEYIIACIVEKNVISKIIIFDAKLKIKDTEKMLAKAKNEEKRKKLEVKLQTLKNELLKKEENEKKINIKLKEKRENPYKIKIQKRDMVKWLILIVVICALTGFLTPLGDTPYTYLIKTMQGNTMKSISEHLPLTLFEDKDTMVALALVLIILIFTDTKTELKDLFMVGGLIYLSFMSRRQISLLFIIGISIFTKWVSYIFDKYDEMGTKKVIMFMTSFLGKVITVVITTIICFYFVKAKMDLKIVDETRYPVKACDWMLENLDVSNIKLYNEYNYGSYLLYRGIPVFIDSRADLYAPEFNKKENEEKGRDIFSEYMNISSIGAYYETEFEKYGITHVMMVKNAKLNMFISRDSKYNELYSDDNFVIYERNVEKE